MPTDDKSKVNVSSDKDPIIISSKSGDVEQLKEVIKKRRGVARLEYVNQFDRNGSTP